MSLKTIKFYLWISHLWQKPSILGYFFRFHLLVDFLHLHVECHSRLFHLLTTLQFYHLVFIHKSSAQINQFDFLTLKIFLPINLHTTQNALIFSVWFRRFFNLFATLFQLKLLIWCHSTLTPLCLLFRLHSITRSIHSKSIWISYLDAARSALFLVEDCFWLLLFQANNQLTLIPLIKCVAFEYCDCSLDCVSS